MNDFPKEEFTNRISKIQENLEQENIEQGSENWKNWDDGE